MMVSFDRRDGCWAMGNRSHRRDIHFFWWYQYSYIVLPLMYYSKYRKVRDEWARYDIAAGMTNCYLEQQLVKIFEEARGEGNGLS